MTKAWKPKKVRCFEWLGPYWCGNTAFGIFCYYCDEVILNGLVNWRNERLKNYRLFRDWHQKEGVCSRCKAILRWKI